MDFTAALRNASVAVFTPEKANAKRIPSRQHGRDCHGALGSFLVDKTLSTACIQTEGSFIAARQDPHSYWSSHMWQPLPASAVRTPFPRAALSFEILTFRISSNWKTIPGLGMERPGRSSRIPSGPWCCASVQGVLHRSFLSTCFVEVATSRRSEAKCQCTECEYVCLCVHAHACMCVCGVIITSR